MAKTKKIIPLSACYHSDRALSRETRRDILTVSAQLHFAAEERVEETFIITLEELIDNTDDGTWDKEVVPAVERLTKFMIANKLDVIIIN